MSKIKSPREKKHISLERDRRNTYGENPTSSRKNIRRGKQRSHMEERRSVGEALRQVRGPSDQENADVAEAEVRARSILLQRHAFKKVPDIPLGAMIERKVRRRVRRKKEDRSV